jgi:sugar/nucleoside kinase (ribokinase family)
MPASARGRVVVCGNVVFDILARPVEEVRWAATSLIETVSQQLGGNAGSTSCTLGILGATVSIVTLAGRDAAGEAVMERLRGAGVDLSLVQYVDAPTSIAICLIRSSGERALLYQLAAAAEDFQPFSLPPDATRFHLAAVYRMRHLREIAPALLRRAKEAGLETSLATQWDTEGEWMKVLQPSLPHTDYILMNEDEARMLTGRTEPEEAARVLRDLGANHVVIKRGPLGCWADGETFPGFDVNAIDTTGAGDCFAGAFLAALERGLPVPGAAQFANAVGALAVQKIGAAAGVRDWEATMLWLAERAEAGRPAPQEGPPRSNTPPRSER